MSLIALIKKTKEYFSHKKYKQVYGKILESEFDEYGGKILKSISYSLNGEDVRLNNVNKYYAGETDDIILYVNKDDVYDYSFEPVKGKVSHVSYFLYLYTLVPVVLIFGASLLFYIIIFLITLFAS